LVQATVAPAADAAGATGTGGDGWVEVLWTAPAQEQWGLLDVTVEPIAPAESVERDGRRGLWFPVRSAQGDPSMTDPATAEGVGELGGGFVARTLLAELRYTQLAGVLRNEQMSGRCMVNGADAGMRPMFTWRATDGDISIVPGTSGRPTLLRVSELPVRPTPEALAAFTGLSRSYRTPLITTDTVVAHVTAEGRYHPPGS